MSLKSRILRSIPRSKADFEKKKIPFFLLTTTFLIAAVIIFRIAFSVYQYVTEFTLKDLVGMFSTQLQQDDAHRTNILLLGEGGGEHDGANLTDTIIVASFEEEKQSVNLLSIPRDLWLELPGYGSSRINKIYENMTKKYGSTQALDILRKGVENITNLDIPYVAKIDFQAFVEMVDKVDGIDVLVEKSIVDTEYPNEQESGYTTFALDSGLQHLDGATALKYVRSRHSTSDFDRSLRQQKVLQALKEKVENIGFASSPILIKSMVDSLATHVETNLKITEILTLASFVKKIQKDHIVSAVIRDNETIAQGSFLYTPERELYGGAFVLAPIGESYQPIQRYVSLLLNSAEFFQKKPTIEILNGTRHSNLASDIGKTLIPYGFNIIHYGNAVHPGEKPYKITSFEIHDPESGSRASEVIEQFFPRSVKRIGILSVPESSDYDVTIIVGEDSFQEFLKNQR